MQKLRKLFAMLAAIAMITGTSANRAEAATCDVPCPTPCATTCATPCYEDDGCYEDCRAATYCAPAIALGAVALIAIIAVAAQHNGHHHSHGHNH